MPGLRSALERLEHEAATWRDEPIRRVALLNRPLEPLRRRQFHSFGKGSFVDRPTWLYGAAHIAVGAGVIVLKGCWLAVERTAWDRPEPALQLRDRSAMRIGCTISAAESVVIDEDVALGAGVTVVDSRHTWSSGHPNPLYSPVESAPIYIGKGCWVADRATITAGSELGEQCAIGSNAVVHGKVPDFSIVVGNPMRVVGTTRT